MLNISKNIGLSIVTFISQMVSGSAIFVIFARLMNLNDFGLISFGTTLAGLIAVISEFGFSLMAQRDIPQDRYPFNRYVYNTILQKVVISFIALICGVLYLLILSKDDNLEIGLIFLVFAILTSKVMFFGAIFRSKNKFQIETFSALLYSSVITIIVVIYYFLEISVYSIAWGLSLARLIQLIILLIYFYKEFGINDFKYDKTIQQYLFKNSFSFGLLYIIGTFYFSIDSLFIAYYSDNNKLAIYQSFFKIITLMLTINELISNVFLPYLASLYIKKNNDFIYQSSEINKVVISLGLIMFVFINLFAEDVLRLLYADKYLDALIITIPLSLVLFFRITASVYALILTITNNQSKRVIIVLISLIVNVGLNLVFIPKYNFVGAAYVSFITLFVLSTLYFSYSYRVTGSTLINRKVMLVSLLTLSLVILKNLFELKTSFIESAILFLGWLFSFIYIFDKKQIKNYLDRTLKKTMSYGRYKPE